MTIWGYTNKTLLENPLNCEDNSDRILENNELRLIEYTKQLWDSVNRNQSTWSQKTKNNSNWNYITKK